MLGQGLEFRVEGLGFRDAQVFVGLWLSGFPN